MPVMNRRSRRSASFLVPLAAVWLVSACGGEKKASEGAQKSPASTTRTRAPLSFDPCALLTAAEVEAAVGWKPLTSEASGSEGYGSCRFTGKKDPMILPPQSVEVGIGKCVTNMPCSEPLPDFRSSEEMAQYRIKGYGNGKFGAFEGVKPEVVPLKDFGVPAIDHELATNRSVEMLVGHERLAYVTTWVGPGPTRDLAKKALARIR